MKKSILAVCCLLAFAGFRPAYAASTMSPGTTFPPGTWLDMKASEFVKLSAKDFVKISGKKMNLKDRINFSFMKKDMKKVMRQNTDLTVREYLASDHKKISTGAWIAIIVGVALLTMIIVGSATGLNW